MTVTFRDEAGLTRTLASLAELATSAGADLQLVVVDGDASIAVEAIVRHSAAAKTTSVTLISEPDAGIYDAMNKGLDASTGDFVWFLNGGDESEVASWDALAATLRERVGTLVLADYVLDTGRGRIRRHARDASYLWHGLPTSHQAIFYPGELVRAARYNLDYRVVGDYELTARLTAEGVRASSWPQPVAVFFTGGMSQQNARTVAREAGLVQLNVLGRGRASRALSQVRHAASRTLRALQSRSREAGA